MMIKILYLHGFVRSTKRIWWDKEINYLLVYKIFGLAVEWILAIRNKAEIIFSSKNHCITAVTGKKVTSIFCVSGVMCSPPHFAVQIE